MRHSERSHEKSNILISSKFFMDCLIKLTKLKTTDRECYRLIKQVLTLDIIANIKTFKSFKPNENFNE
jgi:hypothetical protein